MNKIFSKPDENSVSSSTESNRKSDLPVQSLPAHSWSSVVWQILASLQSFAQIPPPPPPPPRLQLLCIDAQCSYTRLNSAGCSRADGPEGSSQVTFSLLNRGHWQMRTGCSTSQDRLTQWCEEPSMPSKVHVCFDNMPNSPEKLSVILHTATCF